MPVSPRNLKVVLAAKSRPWVMWDGQDDCYIYHVERRVQDDDAEWKSLGVVEGTSYSDRGATIGKVNIYRVSAVSKDGDSEPCPEVSILVTPCREEIMPRVAAQSTINAGHVRIRRARQRVVDVD